MRETSKCLHGCGALTGRRCPQEKWSGQRPPSAQRRRNRESVWGKSRGALWFPSCGIFVWPLQKRAARAGPFPWGIKKTILRLFSPFRRMLAFFVGDNGLFRQAAAGLRRCRRRPAFAQKKLRAGGIPCSSAFPAPRPWKTPCAAAFCRLAAKRRASAWQWAPGGCRGSPRGGKAW